LWKSSGFAPTPPPPGHRRRSSVSPARHSGAGPEGLGTGKRAFFLASRIEEAPHAPRVGAGAAPSPNPPPRPASGSHRLLHTLDQAGEQYGPSIAPFARARCPAFPPLYRPYSPAGGAARGSAHTGQFSYFGPRSCFIAFALDIPNGVWLLDRAVGRAYVRETVATSAQRARRPCAALGSGEWGASWGVEGVIPDHHTATRIPRRFATPASGRGGSTRSLRGAPRPPSPLRNTGRGAM
jgi:hypothetical protein